MKRYTRTAAAMAIATGCVVGTSAQSGNTQSGSKSDKNTITVIGCLQDGGTVGGPGSATTSGSSAAKPSGSMGPASYVLRNATMGSATGGGATSSNPGSSTATTGSAASGSSTPGAMPSGPVGSSYILDGRDSDLKNHVGHKIEVTGTADSSTSGGGQRTDATGATGSSATGGTTAGTTSGTTGSGSMSNMAGGTRLHVSSVRMISSDCGAK